MIHKFTIHGVYIVLDVYSGAVHSVDEIVYDILDCYHKDSPIDLKQHQEVTCEDIYTQLGDKYTMHQIQTAYDEIAYLKQNELLFTDDPYATYVDKWDKQSVVKAMCLHVAHDCNLRCKYCFGATGSYEGTRGLMSEDIGKRAVDFLIAHSGERRNLEIDFFGGEPLMNFDVVKQIVAYALAQGDKHNKQFRFTITTNGLLLDDENMAYIQKHMSNVVLSLDGTKAVNDYMRIRVDGKGCYDAVVPKYLKLANIREQDNYYVRGTFTRHNLDFAKDVMHLADLGFKQTSVEPVVLSQENEHAIRQEDIPRLFEEYENLAHSYINRRKEGKGFNFFHFMIDLTQGPCVVKRLSGCGSGHEYVAVTPEGDIYPCHQFVGNKIFKMGDVLSGTFDNEISTQFRKSNVYTKPKCRECWAKFYCSGGCPANAYQFNKDIEKPYEIACELEKKRIECALMIQAIEITAKGDGKYDDNI